MGVLARGGYSGLAYGQERRFWFGEPRTWGHMCSVKPAQCPFCHWVGHNESVCDVKCASYLATHHAHNALAKYDGTYHEGSSTCQHHPQITPPTASTDTTASMPTPLNTECSRSPEGMTLKGTYMIPRRHATAAAPLGLLHSPSYMPRTHVFLCGASPSRAMLRGDLDPCSHRVSQHGRPGRWVGMVGGPPGYLHQHPSAHIQGSHYRTGTQH